MYEIIRSVITAGGYKLAEIQHKVKKLYILGDLTEEQTDELLALAAQGVSADAERPEVLTMLRNLSARIDAHDARLTALEGGAADNEEPAAYEEWAAWDGVSDKYQQGAVVTHSGKLWRSAYNGQNVWEPGTAGTESLWVEYTPDTEEE